MSNFKPMTQLEWEAREGYYSDLLVSPSMMLPIDPSPGCIMNLEATIDAVYSEARLELAHCKRQMEITERKFKAGHKEAYLTLKDQGKTDKEREALAVTYLKTTPIDGMNMTVYQAFDVAEFRFMFMDAVIDILREKHGRCITDSGLLKLEDSLNNVRKAA